MGTKICKKCGTEKSVFDFGKSGCITLADGTKKQHYKTTCKQCTNKGRTRVDNVDPKVCNKCGLSKPLSEYHYEKNRDRYRGQCRKCKNVVRKKHYPKVKNKINEKNRERWANEPGYAEKQLETNRKSREKHKDRWNKLKRERYVNDPDYAEKCRQAQKDLRKNSEYRAKLYAKNKIYREKNKETLKIKQQKYIEENKGKIKERQRKYYYDNPEHIKKLRKALYEKHQEKLVEEQRRIRDERRAILSEHLGGKCVRCGSVENLEFDHIFKENKSFTIGSSLTCFSIEDLILEADKCQLLCRPCHIEKTREEGDWRKLTDEERKNRIRR